VEFHIVDLDLKRKFCHRDGQNASIREVFNKIFQNEEFREYPSFVEGWRVMKGGIEQNQSNGVIMGNYYFVLNCK
jgi:hypothetical protein